MDNTNIKTGPIHPPPNLLFGGGLLDGLKLKYIGGRHTEVKNIHKGMKGVSEKEIEQAIKNLLNKSIIQTSIKTRETHMSINPKKMKEVHKILGERHP